MEDEAGGDLVVLNADIANNGHTQENCYSLYGIPGK